MRCKYCGSTGIHLAEEQKGFSVGKAVAGTIAFGAAGAVAGLAGKNIRGYRCGACGGFMTAPMDATTERFVNDAVFKAKEGKDYSQYTYYRQQYPNIEYVQEPSSESRKIVSHYIEAESVNMRSATRVAEENSTKEKLRYEYTNWEPECPVCFRTVILKNGSNGDSLSLIAYNQSKNTLRSVYLQIKAYDDTGDLLINSRCVYQGMSVKPGELLPENQSFALGTDISFRVEILCEKAAFEDGEVWRRPEELDSYNVVPQVSLQKETFPRFKYLQESYRSIFGTKATAFSERFRRLQPSIHMIYKASEYWQCACGMPVKAGAVCPVCRSDYESLEKIFSQKYLEEKQHDSILEIARSRAEETTAARSAAEEAWNSDIYQEASQWMARGTEQGYDIAAGYFLKIPNYRDAHTLHDLCLQKKEELVEEARKRQEEERKQKEEEARQEEIRRAEAKKKEAQNKKVLRIVAAIAVISFATMVVVKCIIIPNNKYKEAMALKEAGEYEEAIEAFEAMGGYKDSKKLIEDCKEEIEMAKKDAEYSKAVSLMETGDYEEALAVFRALYNYRDSLQQVDTCITAIKDNQYKAAMLLMEQGDYDAAIKAFKDIKSYKDSKEQIAACENAIKDINYNSALEMIEDGNYIAAYKALGDLGGYKESSSLKASIREDFEMAVISKAKVGDIVTFGQYEQDGRSNNGKEDIEWIVLDKKMNDVLLITGSAIEAIQFSNIDGDRSIRWSNCSLRKWLNADFLQNAFTDTERGHIILSNVSADKNPRFNVNSGSSTQDRVFILSIPEAEKYFPTDESRKARPHKKYGNTDWFLRTSGQYNGYITVVGQGGWINYVGFPCFYEGHCVRPAMWVRLGQ